MPALQVGERAPAFTAATHDGSSISLADYLGERGLVLFFYPRDGTPVCTKEACSFRDSYAQFVDAGFQVIGVSSDSAESHRAFADEHRLPFPLIADTDGALRKLFRVPSTLGLFPGRVTYVIDREGFIQLVFSAQLASDAHVQQALDAITNTTK